MRLKRVGNKIISLDKISEKTESIIADRSLGLSQKDVADKYGIDRAFVSRLEGLGEIRTGDTIAAIGFPIKNKSEVEELLRSFGVEHMLLLSDLDRFSLLSNYQGFELINFIMDVVKKFMKYSLVIVIGSKERIGFVKELLSNRDIIGIEIGKSPIEREVLVDLEMLREVLKNVCLEEKS